MGVISVMGCNLSNSAAELVPNLTAECGLVLKEEICKPDVLGGLSSSCGVEIFVSLLSSMVPGGEGWRRRGVMEDAVPILPLFFCVERLNKQDLVCVDELL